MKGRARGALVRWRWPAVIAVAYALAGKVGLRFAVVNPSATALWPPAGIALAGFLLFGARIWPAIFIGAFFVNVTTAGSVATSLGIAVGNTLEAAVGAWLVRRFAQGARAFERAPDIFRFALLAGMVSTAVSATIGVTTLALGGYAPWAAFGSIWLTWWMGDAAGDILVTPVLVLWSREHSLGALGRRPLEAAALAVSVVLVGWVTFGGGAAPGAPLTFLSIPPLIWAAFRFGRREAATAVVVLSAIAVAGTVRGFGPFTYGTPNESLLLLQAFAATMAATILPVAALVWERRAAEEERATLLTRARVAQADAEGRRQVAEELAHVARTVSESLDGSAVAEHIVQVVLDLFHARASGLRLLAADGALVGLSFGGGMKSAFAPGHIVRGGPASVSGLAIMQGRAAWTEDSFADPRLDLAEDLRRAMTAADDGAVLAVPLQVKGRIFGALSIADRAGRRFTKTEADTLQAFADQAALALENARLYEDARRQTLEAEVVADLARRINASLDLDTTLERLLEGARELCDGDLAKIALRDPRTGTVVLRHRVGTRWTGYHDGMTVGAGKGSGGQVLITGRPFRTENYAEDPRVSQDDLPGAAEEGILAQLVVPIPGDGTLVGLLYVERRTSRPFTDRDEAILGRLADHAAIAIRNVQLFAREQTARTEAETANRAKDSFLAVLSHELRTPLNAMTGWVRMLRNPKLDEDKRAHGLDVIERNARLQAQLINDLLDVSRIIAGKLELERYPVDLVPVIQEAIDAVRSEVEAKGVALAVDLEDATGEVLGDARRLLQVVGNLLSNAIKFTPAGGRLTVSLAGRNHRARLTVSDTGEGIAPELLPHIFEAFRQADNSSTRAHQGLGLGLAIVRQIVESHGGRIHAESAGPGRGATFTIELPIATLRLPRGRAGQMTGEQTDGSTARGPRLDGLRALIVDDHADARELIGLALRQHGVVTHLAASVHEALGIIAETPVDVLVSDLAMPEADGYALLRAVRALEPRVRAVAVTAYAGAEVRQRVVEAGFEGYATKPVDPDELVALIAALATHGRNERDPTDGRGPRS
jgi:signal transduction histidine kinase/ActR/RegA family two-component response regulator